MKRTREVLRLHLLAGLSSRKIQGATGVARTTVQDYIKRCEANGLTLEEMNRLDDDALSVKLFGQRKHTAPAPAKVMPDYNTVHQELKQSKADKTKVTLMFLWEAYKAQYGDSLSNIPSFGSTTDATNRSSTPPCDRYIGPERRFSSTTVA